MTVTMGSRYCKSLTTATIYAPFPDEIEVIIRSPYSAAVQAQIALSSDYTSLSTTVTLSSGKATTGISITGLTITVDDSSVTVVDASNVNSLYKCDSSSTFPLIPVGTVVVTGAAMKIRKRWANA